MNTTFCGFETGSDFRLKDCVSISDFSRQDLEFVLEKARLMKAQKKAEKARLLEGKTVASLFFEPSTRTRLSFETAIQNLGGKVIGFADANVSSFKKGETLSDTIRIIESYADCIVMRHFIEGAARRASEIARIPVINAGDGSNQHPTQTLLDLFTIQECFARLDSLSVGMIGDLKYGRTVHSLSTALAKFNSNSLCFISPIELRMPRYLIEEIQGKVKVAECEKWEECIAELDVLYATRIQKERFLDETEFKRVENAFVLGKEVLEKAKPHLKIMHPLPRINEIKPELDETSNAVYFQQAANGIPVREALLDLLVNKKVKK